MTRRRFRANPTAFAWMALGGVLSLLLWSPVPVLIFVGLSLVAFQIGRAHV